MTEPVAEAFELVEHGVITERDFRDLTFVNPVRLHAGAEPSVLRRHACAKRRPRRRWPTPGRCGCEPATDARPLRSVRVRARRRRRRAGGDGGVGRRLDGRRPRGAADAVSGVANASAAASVAREFFDSLGRRASCPLLFARVQPPSTGQTLKDLRAVVGPSLTGIAAAEDHIARPTCTCVDALLACTEVDFGLELGQLVIYPILETAQAIRLAYEIAMASPRVAYMGGALSRFGDIHQALGYRWTAEGEETLFLRSKVLVDAGPPASATRSAACGAARSTTSTGCARSRRSCATSATTG